MSRTLNLVDSLLLMGRRHQQLGRTREALTLLVRLAGFRELPPSVAEEAQARLGEIQFKRRKYHRACRHLTIALRHDPENAHYHRLMGATLRQQDEDQWDRAAEHYRRSLQIEPDCVTCLIEFGLFAIRLGHVEEGLGHLRRAVELRPGDPEAAGKLAEGLRLAGRPDEARTALQAALFRNPRDHRFRQLWANFQFRQLRRQQARELLASDDDGPVLLPFVLSERPSSRRGRGKILRHDDPAPLTPPHDNRKTPLPERHVQ
jgi:tetratricopeptide (TPR) repeat protein